MARLSEDYHQNVLYFSASHATQFSGLTDREALMKIMSE